MPSLRTRISAMIASAAVCWLPHPATASQVPDDIDEVLFRANQSVLRQQRALTRIVGDEESTQQMIDVRDGTVRRSRTIVSRLALVRMPEDEHWVGFREVVEVDGQPVRPSEPRLDALLIQSDDEDALASAARISNAGARHALDEAAGIFSAPTMPLVFLSSLYQHRFRFEKGGEDVIDGQAVWVLRYSEHSRPTVIRSAGTDLFSRGLLWIDPETGEVLRTQHALGDAGMGTRSEVTVNYRHDDRLGAWVPHDAHELHEFSGRRSDARLEISKAFSNFQAVNARP